MGKENLNELGKELKKLAILFLLLVVIFKIVFYKESLWITVRLIFAFSWLYLLPGFAILYFWREKLNFLERLVISIPLGMSIIAIFGYNLGLLGLHVKYVPVIIPLAVYVIILSLFLIKKFRK